MEIIIVICLLTSIFLFVQDKVVSKRKSKKKSLQVKVNFNLPDIMGQPKPKRSLWIPNAATKQHMEEARINTDNLDIEYDDNEEVNIQIPQEELEEVFHDLPDFKVEEEEWNRYGISGADDGLAQGVSFEELSSVGILLQKERLEPSQKETAVAIVQKIQGTELFSLLENSIEGASRRIAELLDNSIPTETDAVSRIFRKTDLGDFDIGKFV